MEAAGAGHPALTPLSSITLYSIGGAASQAARSSQLRRNRVEYLRLGVELLSHEWKPLVRATPRQPLQSPISRLEMVACGCQSHALR